MDAARRARHVDVEIKRQFGSGDANSALNRRAPGPDQPPSPWSRTATIERDPPPFKLPSTGRIGVLLATAMLGLHTGNNNHRCAPFVSEELSVT